MPDKPREPDYGGDIEVRRVRPDGYASWRDVSLKLTPLLAGQPVALALADLNGDGALDVLVGTDTLETSAPSDRVYMMLGDGDGSFRTPVTFAVGSRPNAVIAADMNGDGTPDIVTANQSDDSITVLAMGGCGGTPGEAWPTVCVQGASCSGQINWQCSAGASSPQCTLLCDCTTSGVYCEEGCP